MPQNEVYHRRCWLAPRSKKTRFVGEADFCQGHPAQIWWTVILDPGSLLVVHLFENFVDMTHFNVLEGSRNGDHEQQQAERESRDVIIPVEYSRRPHGTISRGKVQHVLAMTTNRFRARVLGSALRSSVLCPETLQTCSCRLTTQHWR